MVCGATVEIATPFPWRCPNSTTSDRHHVLAIVNGDPSPAEVSQDGFVGRSMPIVQEPDSAATPYSSYDSRLAWAAYAEVNGMDAVARRAIVE